MTRAARAYYGAATGALLSLLLHPVSSPYITGILRSWGPSQTQFSSPDIPSNLNRLPQPRSDKDLDTFALWMLVGSEALVEKRALGPDDLKMLVQVAVLGRKADVTNAFWPQ